MENGAVKIKGNQTLSLWSCTVGFFFGIAAVSLFGPTAHKLGVVMGLSPTDIGVLVAIPSLSGSLLRIPFGAWVDTSGGKKPFNILLILAIIGIVGLLWVVNAYYPHKMEGKYPLVLLFGLLAGCGVATFSVGMSQASYWFGQKQQGYVSGIFGGVGTLAPGFFALVLPIAIEHIGLGDSYVAWTFILIIGTVIYIIFTKNAPYFQYRKKGLSPEESKEKAAADGQELFPNGNIMQSLSISAKVPETWILTSLFFVSFGGFLALTEWYPDFWRQYYNIDPVMAGILTAGFSMLSAIIRAFAGPSADKFGGRNLCVYSMVVMLIGSVGMSFSHNFVLSVICTILIAAAMGVNSTAVFKLAPVYIPKAVGGASGWIGGFGALSGFILPPVMGMIATKYGKVGYAQGFQLFTILSVINLIILWLFMKPGKHKTTEKAQI